MATELQIMMASSFESNIHEDLEEEIMNSQILGQLLAADTLVFKIRELKYRIYIMSILKIQNNKSHLRNNVESCRVLQSLAESCRVLQSFEES